MHSKLWQKFYFLKNEVPTSQRYPILDIICVESNYVENWIPVKWICFHILHVITLRIKSVIGKRLWIGCSWFHWEISKLQIEHLWYIINSKTIHWVFVYYILCLSHYLSYKIQEKEFNLSIFYNIMLYNISLFRNYRYNFRILGAGKQLVDTKRSKHEHTSILC